MSTYKIIDEPTPSPISRLATNPMWPLLAVMLASPIFGWIWFVVNSIAIGSPTKLKEFLMACVGVIFLSVFYIYLGSLNQSGDSGISEYIDYIRLAGVIVSISISYYLFVAQQQPFGLYEYFGGTTMNAIPILVVGFLFGNKVQSFILTSILQVIA